MTLPAIDIDALLRPISEDNPAGTDPRTDVSPQSVYFRLRDARAEARQIERNGDHDGGDTGTPTAWNAVRDHALTILSGIGKDIEVAAWLAEALVRQRGLAGLTQGAVLITGLVRGYWNQGLYPGPDEDGLEGRTTPVAGLNGVGNDGTLMQPLRKLVLFDYADQSAVTLWRFERAEEVEGIGEAAKKKQKLASGVLPFRDLEEAARTIGAAKLAATGHEADATLVAWRGLETALAEVAGRDAPPSTRVSGLLEKMIRIAERYVPDRLAQLRSAQTGEAPEAVGDGPEGAAEAGDEQATGEGVRASPKRPTREGMLATLLEVAEFFRTHEPHSPLAYTLDEAVRRARMSWPELLGELVPDPGARAVILSQLGIRPDAG
ncbi:type VI secretion system protein TssA [Lichenicola sp.]|uniref:type VI secretion system protein TssA n=1 Tax=Lichenicola sp. TaxID=2804529 RepID=UPI003B00EFD5